MRCLAWRLLEVRRIFVVSTPTMARSTDQFQPEVAPYAGRVLFP